MGKAQQQGIGTPALSEMSAVVRLTIKSRPSVSTAMWRCVRDYPEFCVWGVIIGKEEKRYAPETTFWDWAPRALR
jgi:hypothetical protein